MNKRKRRAKLNSMEMKQLNLVICVVIMGLNEA